MIAYIVTLDYRVNSLIDNILLGNVISQSS